MVNTTEVRNNYFMRSKRSKLLFKTQWAKSNIKCAFCNFSAGRTRKFEARQVLIKIGSSRISVLKVSAD